jgi:chromate transport protein ChrA
MPSGEGGSKYDRVDYTNMKVADASVKNILKVFLKIGTFAVGGLYSMLAFFERELVQKKK